MAKFFDAIDDEIAAFIARQKIFFTGSAAETGRVNVSPKGMDAMRVLGPNRVIYLDLSGSGNETSAHVEANGRLTIMFCAFEGAPLILRLYGMGKIHRRGSEDYRALIGHFEEFPGTRQIIDMQVQSVQTSCGYAVPLLEYREDRPNLVRWAEHKGPEGIAEYNRTRNVTSIDGLPTGWTG